MDNQIILYNNQTVDSFIYSSEFFSDNEKNAFLKENSDLLWEEFSNAKIICNFNSGITSSIYEDTTDVNHLITGYQISKKTSEENFIRNIGSFATEELKENENGMFYIVDHNVKNNIEYTYFLSPLDEDTVQTTISNKIITDWDVFSLTPIYKIQDNKYGVIKDEFGEAINWIFQLNCEENEIVLTQDKTVFTTFASKPKISVGDLNYHTGSFSCLLGNTLYNDQYYEPNILLDKWDKMVQKNHIYLFKNPKGDAMVISLEDGTKRKYMNEAANYYVGTYNMNTAITNRPTTIEFSYMEILNAENITIYGD